MKNKAIKKSIGLISNIPMHSFFSDKDIVVINSYQWHPLFLEVVINEVSIRRALVDIGSSINIFLEAVLKVAKIPSRAFTAQSLQYLDLVICLNLYTKTFDWI